MLPNEKIAVLKHKDEKGRFIIGNKTNVGKHWKLSNKAKENIKKGAIKYGVGKWMEGRKPSLKTKQKMKEAQILRSCHTKTNFKRDYWIEYFKKICL